MQGLGGDRTVAVGAGLFGSPLGVIKAITGKLLAGLEGCGLAGLQRSLRLPWRSEAVWLDLGSELAVWLVRVSRVWDPEDGRPELRVIRSTNPSCLERGAKPGCSDSMRPV